MNIFTVLQVIFIVLKVLDLIDWSWWLVFVPTYISIVVISVLIFLVLMFDSGTSKTRNPTRWY